MILAKLLHIRLDKRDGFDRVYNGNRFWLDSNLKNMIPFTIRLDIKWIKKYYRYIKYDVKLCIKYVVSYNYVEIEIYYFPLQVCL